MEPSPADKAIAEHSFLLKVRLLLDLRLPFVIQYLEELNPFKETHHSTSMKYAFINKTEDAFINKARDKKQRLSKRQRLLLTC